MQHEPINCKICGKSFIRSQKSQLFCSGPCKKEAMRLRSKEANEKRRNEKRRKEKKIITVKCGICGNEFETTTLNKKYCSPRCTRQAREAVLKKSSAKRKTVQKKQKRKKLVVSIPIINEQARTQRLSYGQLVAREWMGVM